MSFVISLIFIFVIGNLDSYVPFVLKEIETQPKRQYLLLHSLKEIISAQSSTPSGVKALGPYVPPIWTQLFNHCECNEEGNYIIDSEIICRLFLIRVTNNCQPKCKDCFVHLLLLTKDTPHRNQMNYEDFAFWIIWQNYVSLWFKITVMFTNLMSVSNLERVAFVQHFIVVFNFNETCFIYFRYAKCCGWMFGQTLSNMSWKFIAPTSSCINITLTS